MAINDLLPDVEVVIGLGEYGNTFKAPEHEDPTAVATCPYAHKTIIRYTEAVSGSPFVIQARVGDTYIGSSFTIQLSIDGREIEKGVGTHDQDEWITNIPQLPDYDRTRIYMALGNDVGVRGPHKRRLALYRKSLSWLVGLLRCRAIKTAVRPSRLAPRNR